MIAGLNWRPCTREGRWRERVCASATADANSILVGYFANSQPYTAISVNSRATTTLLLEATPRSLLTVNYVPSEAS